MCLKGLTVLVHLYGSFFCHMVSSQDVHSACLRHTLQYHPVHFKNLMVIVLCWDLKVCCTECNCFTSFIYITHRTGTSIMWQCYSFLIIFYVFVFISCILLLLAFGTQVCGFKPGRSRRIFKGEKILSTPSFEGEVKPSVPCRRFAACKRSLELRGSRILDEICRNISRPWRVPPSAARGLSRRWTWRHLAEKVGTSKGGGKQWQPTPKNLPRMQCARAIPVAWLGSGSC